MVSETTLAGPVREITGLIDANDAIGELEGTLKQPTGPTDPEATPSEAAPTEAEKDSLFFLLAKVE